MWDRGYNGYNSFGRSRPRQKLKRRIRRRKSRLRKYWSVIGNYSGYSWNNVLLKGKERGRALCVVLGILLFSVLVSRDVRADSFYPAADTYNCNILSFAAVQYNSLGGGGVRWNSGDVRGVTGNWIQSHRFTDIGRYLAPARRYPGVADHVAVPPNTQVDLGLYFFNYAEHNVRVGAVDLFLSRLNSSQGDAGRLGSGGSWASTCWKYLGRNYCRTGRRLSRSWNSTYRHWVNNFGQIAYSFSTIQPIQTDSFENFPEWDGANLKIRYELILKNISQYNLCGIRVIDELPDGEVYDESFCLNSGQSRKIEYFADMGEDYPLTIVNDPARIIDPNRHREVIYGRQLSSTDQNPDAKPAIFARDDYPHTNWYGRQPVWGENGDFYIELIPYWFYSPQVRLDLSPNVKVEKFVSDDDEIDVKENTAKNREALEYKIRVSNSGARAENLEVVDDYDEELVEILDAAGGDLNNGEIAWLLDNLGHSESAEFIVNARIKDLYSGSYQIENFVSAGEIIDSVVTHVATSSELDIGKEMTSSEVTEPGRRLFHFSISYNNTGDATAKDVTVFDDLSGFSDLEFDVKNISADGVYDENEGKIIWELGNLEYFSEGIVSFDLDVLLPDDLCVVSNTAVIKSSDNPEDSVVLDVEIPARPVDEENDDDDESESGRPAQNSGSVLGVSLAKTGSPVFPAAAASAGVLVVTFLLYNVSGGILKNVSDGRFKIRSKSGNEVGDESKRYIQAEIPDAGLCPKSSTDAHKRGIPVLSCRGSP